jgi:hypothetical protein
MKSKLSSTEQLRETDTQLRVVGRMVRPTESVNVVDADSTDNRILECAVAADAKAETEKPSPPLWTKGGKARAAKLTPGERKRARTRKCTVHFFRVQSRIRRNDSPVAPTTHNRLQQRRFHGQPEHRNAREHEVMTPADAYPFEC